MTAKKILVHGFRHPPAVPPRVHGRRTEMLRHRWPAAFGIAVAALAVFDLADGTVFSTLVVLMALVYLGAAALDRRRAAWAVLLAGVAVMIALPLLGPAIDPSVVLLVAALVLLALRSARGLLRRPGGLTLQAVGMLGFGSVGLVALYAHPTLGGYLVAAALLSHAAWDAFHYLRDGVVVRSYAEFCAVVDLLLGLSILLMA